MIPTPLITFDDGITGALNVKNWPELGKYVNARCAWVQSWYVASIVGSELLPSAMSSR